MSNRRKAPTQVDAYPTPERPHDMGPSASRWWDQVIAMRPGMISPVDAFLMGQACKWLNAIDHLWDSQAEYVGTRPPAAPGEPPNESAEAQPAVVIVPRMHELAKAVSVAQAGFLKICGELGLTPKAAKSVKTVRAMPKAAGSNKPPKTRLERLKPTPAEFAAHLNGDGDHDEDEPGDGDAES